MAGDVLFIVSSLGLNVSLFQIGRVSILATGSTENGEQCPKNPARARVTLRNYGDLPTSSTVRLGKAVKEHLALVCRSY